MLFQILFYPLTCPEGPFPLPLHSLICLETVSRGGVDGAPPLDDTEVVPGSPDDPFGSVSKDEGLPVQSPATRALFQSGVDVLF